MKSDILYELLFDLEFTNQEDCANYLESDGINLQESYEDFCRLVMKKRGELLIKRGCELSQPYHSVLESSEAACTIHEAEKIV